MPKVDDQIVIVGAGETPVGKLPGMSSLQIQALAVSEALRDANLTIRDVDGLINLDPYATPQSMFSITLLGYLGIKAKWSATVDVGGTASIMAMLQQAVWAIQSGHCETVAVVVGENLNTCRAPGSHGMLLSNMVGGEEWEEPYGITGAVVPYAMLAERYMHDTGATAEDFGEVALVTRRHALLNPNAIMKKPLSMEDYLGSRVISSPFRLFDCSIPADGGGALILTTRDRAASSGRTPVSIRSMAMEANHGGGVIDLPDIPEFGIRAAGENAFNAAGVGPEDMDVAMIHDAFTVSVLLTLEALGFAQPGEGGAYMRSGAASLGGRCPINPHGGLLSQAHVGGILHFVEAVRQLRHEAGPRQAGKPRFAISSGNGGIFSICSTMILEGAQNGQH